MPDLTLAEREALVRAAIERCDRAASNLDALVVGTALGKHDWRAIALAEAERNNAREDFGVMWADVKPLLDHLHDATEGKEKDDK